MAANSGQRVVMGYLSGRAEYEAIDDSHLPMNSLVCMNCSWLSDEECTDASRIGEPCAICGQPCEPHEEEGE